MKPTPEFAALTPGFIPPSRSRGTETRRSEVGRRRSAGPGKIISCVPAAEELRHIVGSFQAVRTRSLLVGKIGGDLPEAGKTSQGKTYRPRLESRPGNRSRSQAPRRC